MTKKQHIEPLEAGLLTALGALNNQIARSLQRDTKQSEVLGVSKNQAIQERVERLASFLLEEFGNGRFELEPLLICAESFSKTISLITQELGREGLGKVRSAYVEATFKALSFDSERALGEINSQENLLS